MFGPFLRELQPFINLEKFCGRVLHDGKFYFEIGHGCKLVMITDHNFHQNCVIFIEFSEYYYWLILIIGVMNRPFL